MSDRVDPREVGRRLGQAFADAAEAMRKFAEVWNDGPTAPSYPLLSGIEAQKGKPTA